MTIATTKVEACVNIYGETQGETHFKRNLVSHFKMGHLPRTALCMHHPMTNNLEIERGVYWFASMIGVVIKHIGRYIRSGMYVLK